MVRTFLNAVPVSLRVPRCRRGGREAPGIEDGVRGVRWLRLTAEDRARGFDADALAGAETNVSRSGFGPYSVKGRLALVRGHMDITSSAETSAHIRLTLPPDGLSSLASSPAAP